jgi:hypothetical protein
MLGIKVAANLGAGFRTDHQTELTFVCEYVETDRWNVLRDRRSGKWAKNPAEFPAGNAMPEDFPLPLSVHIRMMPGKWSKVKLDPSRVTASDGNAADIPSADPDGRVGPPDSVGDAGWRDGAAGAGLARGNCCCSSDGHGHRKRK